MKKNKKSLLRGKYEQKIKVGSEKDRLYVIPVTNLFRNTKC